MSLTKKDLEEVSKLATRIVAVTNVLAPLLRPVLRLGFLSRRLRESTGGRVGAISRHAKRGEHEKAAALAIEALKGYQHQAKGSRKLSDPNYWWFFMHLAVRSLEECGDQEKREEVIALARHGVKPVRGHYAARSSLAFSRWKYLDGDDDGAIELAEIAANADDTWAEPDFVLGWYCLVLGGGDPMRHLTQAVGKDHRIIFRIANDAECRKHPHIVQWLKDLSVDYIVTARD